MPESKMICSRCGVEMNLHAEKIDYSSDETEGEALAQDTEDLGGILIEIHTCPACGETEKRMKDEG